MVEPAAFGIGRNQRLGDLGQPFFESNVGGHEKSLECGSALPQSLCSFPIHRRAAEKPSQQCCRSVSDSPNWKYRQKAQVVESILAEPTRKRQPFRRLRISPQVNQARFAQRLRKGMNTANENLPCPQTSKTRKSL